MKGVRERFVVSDDVEVTAFHKVEQVFKGQVNGQQLTVKGAVLLLRGSKLPGEVLKGTPRVVNLLLKDCTHS